MHPITQRNPMKKIRHELMTPPPITEDDNYAKGKSFKTDAVTLDVTLPVTPKPLTNPKKFRIFAS